MIMVLALFHVVNFLYVQVFVTQGPNMAVKVAIAAAVFIASAIVSASGGVLATAIYEIVNGVTEAQAYADENSILPSLQFLGLVLGFLAVFPICWLAEKIFERLERPITNPK